ncbi:hypothetical protein ACQ86G_21840 [Roseateles chitinivorans]|uniref:hypothetical protein n=1 Tax=Roseateles chitinivorans TaxID=2917965 RepID=UPI003D67309D
MALNTRFQNETGSAARQLVEAYLQAAQTLLGQAHPHDAQLGQDGNTGVFLLQSGDQHLELQLSANGVISLRDFGLARRIAAASVPDPGPSSGSPSDPLSHPDQQEPLS